MPASVMFQSTPPARAATSQTLRSGALSGFNPRRPRGRRRAVCGGSGPGNKFQSTPPARAATSRHPAAVFVPGCFNPRRPRGRRHTGLIGHSPSLAFQSTPPARAATWPSITTSRRSASFNPRRPRGRRQSTPSAKLTAGKFQSTPPARAATNQDDKAAMAPVVSIHAARAASVCPLTCFNPRRPRGRRPSPLIDCANLSPFQSTPPARAATSPGRRTARSRRSFNPRRPRGRRPIEVYSLGSKAEFQSTPPARAATRISSAICAHTCMFQSTPPARAATGRTGRGRCGHGVSIHAAREGGDEAADLCVLDLAVSIHAAREGGDGRVRPAPDARPRFNPRRPRGRRRHADHRDLRIQ